MVESSFEKLPFSPAEGYFSDSHSDTDMEGECHVIVLWDQKKVEAWSMLNWSELDASGPRFVLFFSFL